MATMTFHNETVKHDDALITATPPTRPRAYYAHLYDQSGMLTKLNGTIYFLADDTHAITKFEPEHINWCTVLGEVTTSQVQAMWDRINGGPATICTTRPMGRS